MGCTLILKRVFQNSVGTSVTQWIIGIKTFKQHQITQMMQYWFMQAPNQIFIKSVCGNGHITRNVCTNWFFHPSFLPLITNGDYYENNWLAIINMKTSNQNNNKRLERWRCVSFQLTLFWGLLRNFETVAS